MSPAARAPALAAALALAGCAGVGGAPRPVPGSGVTWRELATAHFTLRTDVSPELAERVARRLEYDRALLVAAMPALSAVERRIDVVALSSQEEFRRATGMKTDYVGQAVFDGSGGQRVVIRVSATGDSEQHEIELVHELAHALTRHVIAVQPTWLSEGLACYLSSVAREKGGKRWVGGVPEDGLAAVDPLPVREALEWNGSGQGREERLYATSWRLVRLLATEERAGFAELGRRLDAGEPEEAAWTAALPHRRLDAEGLSRLDRALRSWGDDLPAARREVTAGPGASPAAVRTLTAGEVQTIRLELRPGLDRPALERAVDAALAVDPGNVLALALRGSWSPAERLPLARRAVAAHPDDPQAWVRLGLALPDAASAAERLDAFRRGARLGPDDPLAQAALAFELAGPDPRAAEAHAARAKALAPWSPLALAAHALALARLGRCAEAARELQRGGAANAAIEVEGWAEQRRQVERACPPAASGRP